MNPLDIPLYLWLGIQGVFHALALLPFPSPTDIFKGVIGSFISFLVLWWPRYKLDRIAKQKYLHDHKRRPAPTSSEHQQAAASVSSLFEHH
jgi:hypothetical protein